MYRCPRSECTWVFVRASEVIQHLCEDHRGEEPNNANFMYQCARKDCPDADNSGYGPPDHVMEHLWRVHGTDDFAFCRMGCDEQLQRAGDVLKHLQSHEGLMPYNCRDCRMSFQHYYLLAEHQFKAHRNKKPYFCMFPNCVAVLPNTNAAIEHFQRTHPGGTQHSCALHKCKDEVGEIPEIRRAPNVVAHAANRVFKCLLPNCGKEFPTQPELAAHAKTHPNMSQSAFKCSEPGCQAGFETQGALNRHLKWHERYMPYKCGKTGCSKTFPDQEALNKHMQEHAKDAKFVCIHVTCWASFDQLSALAVHHQKHTGKYGCVAPYCRETFTYMRQLMQHVEEKHSAIQRGYKCKVCGRGFLAKDQFISHAKSHPAKNNPELAAFVQEELAKVM